MTQELFAVVDDNRIMLESQVQPDDNFKLLTAKELFDCGYVNNNEYFELATGKWSKNHPNRVKFDLLLLSQK